MKKIISIIIVIIAIGVLMSCKKNSPKKDNVVFDYDALYKSTSKERYPENLNSPTQKAEYGYTKNEINGYNNWYYLVTTETGYQKMSYNQKSAAFTYQNAKFQNGILTSTKDSFGTLAYKVQVTGKITLYGNIRQSGNNNQATLVKILHNEQIINNILIKENDQIGKYFEHQLQVNEGDYLYFINQSPTSVYLNPVITYELDYEQSLYHFTSFNTCYGDVFPYYDEEESKLYMGFLYSDDARKENNYHLALEESSNLLTYQNIPENNNYDRWQKYKQNYLMNHIFNPNNFIDHSKYAFGIRDNMLYHEKGRYVLIAGCYHEFNSSKQTSDLVIYASDDNFALSWTKKGNVVASYSRNLPECPSLMKIGNRYYVFVSVAYNTAHQVGPLQYWIGDENVDCLDVDWQSKDFNFLDGEDLCAARVTSIKDKVYMWGWIPYTYNTMPWSPWGGYLNLPREVIQLADGTLGSRMDPGLYKTINYGNIYELDESNYQIEIGNGKYQDNALSVSGMSSKVKLGNFKRNLVSFTMNLEDATKGGYLLKQAGKEYYCLIEKENGKTYLKVTSPNDPLHKINSILEIPNYSIYNIKMVIDNGIIEFYVNDEKTLTAHTAMTNASYDAYLYANGSAIYKDVKINKLISYSDI